MSSANNFKRRRLLVAGVIALGVVATGVAIVARHRESTVPALARDLPAEISELDYTQAEREFQRAYGRKADRDDTLSWLGDASFKDNRLEIANACYAAIPQSHPRYGRQALYQRGQLLIHLNRAAEAEKCLREFLALENKSAQSPRLHVVDAIQRLRFLLETQLRFEERKRLIAAMVKSGEGDVFDVMFYAFPALLRWNGPQTIARLEKFWKEDPENLNLRIALARYRLGQGRLDETRAILRNCKRSAPRNLRVIAAQLALWREAGGPLDWDRIGKEIQKLPAPAKTDPWLLLRIRGHWHNRQQQFQDAVNCFQLALTGDSANPESYLGLAKAHAGLRQPEQQKRALDKAQVLARIQPRLVHTQSATQDVQPFIEIAELCEQIDLFESAILVARIARRYAPKNTAAGDLVKRLESAHPSLR